MASVSQAVAAAGGTATNFSPAVPSSRSAPATDSATPVPSVIVSLGTAMQTPLLFTASGLLISATDEVNKTPAPDDNAAGASPTTTSAPSSSTTDTTSAATTVAVQNTAAAITTTAPVIASPAENNLLPLEVITPLPVQTVIDPDVQSLADFTANPVYPGMATALYLNAAIYRAAKPISSAALVSAIDLPGPVAATSSINVSITEGDQQAAENQRRGTAAFVSSPAVRAS